MEKTAQLLKDCLCYSVQIDGSSDRQQVDSKFIAARYVPPEEVSVNTLFLGISSNELQGAHGLLDAFVSCLNCIKVETTKLAGVKTDGQNANPGKNGGLWKLLKEHTGRDILTAWCVCHRSDLALKFRFQSCPFGCLIFLQCQHFLEHHHDKPSSCTRYD